MPRFADALVASISGHDRAGRRALCAGALASMLIVLFGGVASASGTVSKLVFSPHPIGTISTISPGSTVPVTLKAEDSTGTPVAGGTVYLVFGGPADNGSATAGGFRLKPKPRAFIADAGGQVAITYVAPSPFPTTGCDDLKAMNGPTRGSSTAISDDTICFSPITSFTFSPSPIAPTGTLAPNSQVTVTLTARGANGPLANVAVWLTFTVVDRNSGARATVNGVALSSTPKSEATDANGQVIIVYSTGTILPPRGPDRLLVRNNYPFPTKQEADPYKYG